VQTRCSLILAGNWRRLTEQLAADEFIEIPATQSVCSLCEVGIFVICYLSSHPGDGSPSDEAYSYRPVRWSMICAGKSAT